MARSGAIQTDKRLSAVAANGNEETDMKPYCGIDLHSNNNVIVILNEVNKVDERIYQRKPPNERPVRGLLHKCSQLVRRRSPIC